jgi:hypothetical protein
MRIISNTPWIGLLVLAGCVACASGSDETSDRGSVYGDGEIAGSGGGAEGGASAGSEDSAADDGGGAEGGGDPGGPDGGGSGNGPPAGILTAGAWDDNLNYDFFAEYRAEVYGKSQAGLLPIEAAEHEASLPLTDAAANQLLDISLVIDTTGSMGDEISYLQSEFDALSRTIGERFPDAEQRWSLVTYRDETDDYIVRWYDFREDLGEFHEKLREQSAGGGGDYPEAPDRALNVATRLSWRTDDSVARLIFWVADAPHHNENAAYLADNIRDARDQDIHIYPVASSGVDELTELTMRSAAQLTGGRYLFLTDDSGVGGAHKEPTIPCYFVTKLDDAILRMVEIEMSGDYREPSEDEVLRVGGDPDNGICTLSSGEQVVAF